MNLHDQATPQTIALPRNASRLLVRKKTQKRKIVPAVPATIGVSIVARQPWASRLGESANHHDASTIARGP